jgi:prephenate dehydrogenase
MKVAVVGLGLIGGSLARDLASKGHEVLGYDRDRATLRRARRAGAIAETLGPSLDGIEEADVAVIALPVDLTQRVLLGRADRLRGLKAVTDVGSTKRSIMRAAARAGLATNFVGSHPMAGGHESGWAASSIRLFDRKPVYITASSSSTAGATRLVRRLWRAVGGRMQEIGAVEHDNLLAATSHLPQVVALALTMVYADAGIRRGILGRGGKEMTRLAASNPDMWAAILADNKVNVAARIARLRKALGEIEERVLAGDSDALRRLVGFTGRWARSPGAFREKSVKFRRPR